MKRITLFPSSMNINIGTLNLCLGLKNKKDEVKRLLSTNKLDILCLQETELESNYPTDILAFKGYAFEAENNRNKIRTGTYIKDNIGYMRRKDLEKENFHIVIIELNDRKKQELLIFIVLSTRPWALPKKPSLMSKFILSIMHLILTL